MTTTPVTTKAPRAGASVQSANRLPWAVLAAAGLGSFAATASGTTRAPFLLDMARDLSTGLPMVANLISLTSIAWAVTSVSAGMASDRWGRRVFLVGGPLALAFALVGVATGGSFAAVAAWSTVAGGCSGLFMGVMFAEVSARAPEALRGRALGWLMSAQSLVLLVGVPLAAWIGAWIGWRGVNLVIAVLSLAGAASLLVTTGRPTQAGRHAGGRSVSIRAALSPAVLRLLTIGICERICFGLTTVYFATFLQSTYGLALNAVALPLAIFASGNIIGTQIGGQLADRLKNRLRTFAVAMVASGLGALALFGWQADMETSVALGFLYVFLNALGRPSLMAALASVPENVRGTVMGLNGTCASIGWIGAAAIGGWILATFGFAGFGPLAAGISVLGAVLALARRG